jgi:hypothetical protein
MLRRLGRSYRELRLVPLPDGQGSGYAHVHDHFADEVRTQRQRASHTATGLVAMLDADTRTVAAVLSDLEGHLADRRQSAEAIAVLVPKRNIATWLTYLDGNTQVNEQDTYPEWKLRKHEADCQPAVDRFHEIARTGAVPGNCPDSLRRTIEDEYPRIASLSP